MTLAAPRTPIAKAPKPASKARSRRAGKPKRLVTAVVIDRRSSGSRDHVKLHFGMDDAAVARRHIAPPLAAIAIDFHGMEESRVRRETLWDHGSDVLRERVQSWADPRGRGNVT